MHHLEFEKQLAAFVKKEDAMLLNYGYQGVLSIIDSLVDRKDVIVYDSESHACIIDGVRLHMGKRFVYPHNNMENLEADVESGQPRAPAPACEAGIETCARKNSAAKIPARNIHPDFMRAEATHANL